MKKLLASLFFLFISACAYSQITRHVAFKVALSDSSYRHFFDSHRDINWMLLDFELNTPIALSFYNHSNPHSYFHPDRSNEPDKQYDLDFEGDVYWLSEKYCPFVVPELPAVEMLYLPGITDAKNIKTYFDAKAAVYRDSIVYYFSQSNYPDREDMVINSIRTKKKWFVPFFKEGNEVLAKRVEENYRSNGNSAEVDVVVISSALVERDGSLQNVHLLVGDQSSFSEAVQKALEENSQSWKPATQGGRPVRSAVLVYARLGSDKRVTVSVGLDRGQYSDQPENRP